MNVFLGGAWDASGEPLLVEALTMRGVAPGVHRQATKIVMDDYGNAVCYRRRCCCCMRWMPLNFDYFTSRGRDRSGMAMQAICRVCARQKSKYMSAERRKVVNAQVAERRRKRIATDPSFREMEKQREAAARQRRQAEDPERMRALASARQRRHYERIMADPELHARKIENMRIDRVIRGQRDGKQLRGPQGRATPIRERLTHKVTLPGAPVAEYVRNAAGRSDAGGTQSNDGGLIELCEVMGISDRAVRRWENGEGAALASVDSVLTYLGVNWWDIYRPGTPEHEAAARVFVREDHEAA